MQHLQCDASFTARLMLTAESVNERTSRTNCKLAQICQSYEQISSGMFFLFDSPCSIRR